MRIRLKNSARFRNQSDCRIQFILPARSLRKKYIEDITRQREDMNVMSEWLKKYFTSERRKERDIVLLREHKFITLSKRQGGPKTRGFFVSESSPNKLRHIRSQNGQNVERHVAKRRRKKFGEEKREGKGVGEGVLPTPRPPLFSPFSPPPPPSLLFFPLPSFSLVRAFKMAAGRS